MLSWRAQEGQAPSHRGGSPPCRRLCLTTGHSDADVPLASASLIGEGSTAGRRTTHTQVRFPPPGVRRGHRPPEKHIHAQVEAER